MKYTIIKRTFEALCYPKGSAERSRLNEDPTTSEYMPSKKYLVQSPFLMSDGSKHPRQEFIYRDFTTKKLAEQYIELHQEVAL
jgi:hypothetical protein